MYDVVVVYPMRVTPEGVEVLLGQKQYGLGEGRCVGPGGKVEPGEHIREAAVRELAEEVGLVSRVGDLQHIATIEYPFPSRPHLSQRSHAFRVFEFEGEVSHSAELAPRWWALETLPLDLMWSDAPLWLPAALRGEVKNAVITMGDFDEVLAAEWIP